MYYCIPLIFLYKYQNNENVLQKTGKLEKNSQATTYMYKTSSETDLQIYP